MNYSRTMITAGLVLASALRVLAPAGADEKAVRRELETIYSRFAAANKAKDGRALQQVREAVAGPGFVLKRKGEPPVTRKEWVGQPRQGAWTPAREILLTIAGLRIKDGTATARVNSRYLGQAPGQAGTASLVGDEGTFVDTWKRTGGGWKLQRREWLHRKEIRVDAGLR